MRKVTFIALLVLAGAVAVAAQPAPAFKRTLLQQVDLSTAGREAVTARAEFSPGGSVGRHTHFGEEIGYVIEGVLTVEINGVSKEYKAGEAFAVPAGAPHNATNASAGPAAILATYIVEKGKPLATPVK
jgi:quercetin dioxygenase-like cupin family protein